MASPGSRELRHAERLRRFAALAFTNLTEEHLDFHGTMERYYAAKRRLFVGADPPPAAAFTITGRPIFSASFVSVASD